MTGAFADVLARYSQPIRNLDWAPLESSGGLSGAAIWRGDRDSRPLFCAKGYTPGIDPLGIATRQTWCEAAVRAGLAFVPRIVPNSRGETITSQNGLGWEIATWMPGEADFAERPSPAKLLSACDAVIDLLGVWRGLGTRLEVPLAVRNRLALFAEWELHPPACGVGIDPDLESRARAVLASHLGEVKTGLRPWAVRKMPCRPCVRDLRREHFLFGGDRLTGLIDYGAAAWDTPATDAARMLGELAPRDPELYRVGLARFEERLGGDECPSEFVRALDRSGSLASVIRWLIRFRKGELGAAIRPEAERRLNRLVGRWEVGTFS